MVGSLLGAPACVSLQALQHRCERLAGAGDAKDVRLAELQSTLALLRGQYARDASAWDEVS